MKLLQATALVVALAGAVAGQVVIDQQFNPSQTTGATVYSLITPDRQVAQTFTVGTAGVLTQLSIFVFRVDGAGSNADLEIDLRPSNGAPDVNDGSALIRLMIPRATVPMGGFVTLDVTPIGLLVNPGDEYAIVMRRTAGNCPGPCSPSPYRTVSTGISGAPNYTGGAPYTRDDSAQAWTLASSVGYDIRFSTFVDVDPTQVGTVEDLVLTYSVNGIPGTPFDGTTQAGDVLAFHLESPQGTFDLLPPLIFGQVFLTVGPAPTGFFPGIAVDLGPGFFIALDGAATSPSILLPPGGLSFSTAIAPGFGGVTVRLQSLVLDPTATNGIFASTFAHDIKML